MLTVKKTTIEILPEEYLISNGKQTLSLKAKEYHRPIASLWANDIFLVTLGWDEVERNQIVAFDANGKMIWNKLARIADTGEIDPWAGIGYVKEKERVSLVSYFGLAFPILDFNTGELGEPHFTK